jgi:hypothetical protein
LQEGACCLEGKNENVDGPICKTTLKVCVGLYDSVGKKVVSFLSWYYEKMKTSISERKLFTLILVMVLLAVQYVDYETTLSAVRANHLIGEASSFLKMDKAGMGSCLWNAWEKNLLFLPSQTPYNLIMVNLLCTFLLFNYRIAENVLTCLNQKKIIFSLSAAVSVTLILIDGRLLIGSECIGRRSYFSKVRRTWTGWFKRISQTRCKRVSRMERDLSKCSVICSCYIYLLSF